MQRLRFIGKVKGYPPEVHQEIEQVLKLCIDKGEGYHIQDKRTLLPLDIRTLDLDQYICKVTYTMSTDGLTIFVMDYSKALRL